MGSFEEEVDGLLTEVMKPRNPLGSLNKRETRLYNGL